MLSRRFLMMLIIVSMVIAACGGEEEATNTPVPAEDTPVPTETKAEPTMTPTEVPPTSTPEPTATSEPEPEAEPPEVSVSPVGYWEGKISTSGVDIAIMVEFSEDGEGISGVIDIPEQAATGLALDNVTIEGDQLHFEIAAVGANFDGTVADDGIAGDFAQASATGTFELAAAEKPEQETAEIPGDVPYLVEEVSWDIGDTTVEGTLTVPEGEGPFPAIIMIAGSGPTDRNWNSPLLPGSNGSAALFADALTRAGYVTLRYDKRVSGSNAAANAQKLLGTISMDSHLEEAAGGVNLLAEHEAVDANLLYAFGNSEGTIHALNYERQADLTPLAGLILTAPPGRSLAEVMRTQIGDQLAGSSEAEGILTLYDEAIDRFTAGEPMEPSEDLPSGIQQLLLSLEAPANLPFTQELLAVDPAEWLAESQVPILVLIGKKDIQVDWLLDGGRLEEFTSSEQDVTFVYPEDANHVFKFEETAAEELTANDAINYNSDDRTLDEFSLMTILEWLTLR